MMSQPASGQAGAQPFRVRWPLSLLLLAATFFLMPCECRAQSDIETPHTGEVACAQILRLQQKGVIVLYERKYGERVD